MCLIIKVLNLNNMKPTERTIGQKSRSHKTRNDVITVIAFALPIPALIVGFYINMAYVFSNIKSEISRVEHTGGIAPGDIVCSNIEGSNSCEARYNSIPKLTMQAALEKSGYKIDSRYPVNEYYDITYWHTDRNGGMDVAVGSGSKGPGVGGVSYSPSH